MTSLFFPFGHLSSNFLGSSIEVLKLLARLCLTSSHRSIQEEHSTINFQFLTRCACPRANRHSWQPFVIFSCLMSWKLISKWFICSVIMGRLVHRVMLPLRKEGGKEPAIRPLNCLYRLHLACGRSQLLFPVPQFARRKHVSSHTYYPLASVNVYHSQLKAEIVNAIPSHQ